jgi:hypothetical protein
MLLFMRRGPHVSNDNAASTRLRRLSVSAMLVEPAHRAACWWFVMLLLLVYERMHFAGLRALLVMSAWFQQLSSGQLSTSSQPLKGVL